MGYETAGVEDWLVTAVVALYEEPESNGSDKNIQVSVGLGSTLSLLVFVIVMDPVTNDMAAGFSWNILYSDDLVLVEKFGGMKES